MIDNKAGKANLRPRSDSAACSILHKFYSLMEAENDRKGKVLRDTATSLKFLNSRSFSPRISDHAFAACRNCDPGSASVRLGPTRCELAMFRSLNTPTTTGPPLLLGCLFQIGNMDASCVSSLKWLIGPTVTTGASLIQARITRLLQQTWYQPTH